jgi:hypothetical protein
MATRIQNKKVDLLGDPDRAFTLLAAGHSGERCESWSASHVLDDVEVVKGGLAIYQSEPPVIRHPRLRKLACRRRVSLGGILQKLPEAIRLLMLDREDRGFQSPLATGSRDPLIQRLSNLVRRVAALEFNQLDVPHRPLAPLSFLARCDRSQLTPGTTR